MTSASAHRGIVSAVDEEGEDTEAYSRPPWLRRDDRAWPPLIDAGLACEEVEIRRSRARVRAERKSIILKSQPRARTLPSPRVGGPARDTPFLGRLQHEGGVCLEDAVRDTRRRGE